ncbi:MAG: Uma2 family endonuclease [Pirellulaceae bacterium]
MASAGTLAELIDELGGVSPRRILLRPAPGTATEQDLLARAKQKAGVCELVDVVLVEKAMGFRESLLALALTELLRAFVKQHNLGLIAGAAGLLRLTPGLVRGPDVSFVSWSKIPDGRVPQAPIPDLAVEILSESNTSGEMLRKRRDYFTAGTRAVWQFDLNARTAEVFTSPADSIVVGESQILDGGDVLPGFSLPLAKLFAELDQRAQ